MKSSLGHDAKIVHSVHFENAIAKIMSGRESTITANERDAAKSLLKDPENVDGVLIDCK